MDFNYITCHYAEIGLKGNNRKFFEETLVRNIRSVLDSNLVSSIRRISGRIIVKLTPEGRDKEEEISSALKKVFGLAYFGFATSVPQEIGAMEKAAADILKGQKFETFKIATQRSNKDFPLNSQEVSEKVGAFVVGELGKKVNLSHPDATCFIEIAEGFAFLYSEKIKGPGGLPAGSAGRAVVLLSGGIDSPVASYYVQKRGAEAVFVHFHSFPYTPKTSVEKVEELAKIMARLQSGAKIFLVPFGDIQKEIFISAPAKLRVVLYRRFMMRIAERIAEQENAPALVTGESLGQVASQTLGNMRAIEDVVRLPVLRPLVGFDKEEIIQKAKEIGTYEISILPHDDCCSRFLPDHPETKARLSEVREAEKNLDVKKLIKEALDKTEKKEIGIN